jgi:hypothetical protein
MDRYQRISYRRWFQTFQISDSNFSDIKVKTKNEENEFKKDYSNAIQSKDYSVDFFRYAHL